MGRTEQIAVLLECSLGRPLVLQGDPRAGPGVLSSEAEG